MGIGARLKSAWNALRGVQAAGVSTAPTGHLFNRMGQRQMRLTNNRNLFNNYEHQKYSRQAANLEVQCNGYAYGVTRSKSVDRIGTGPRLIIRTGNTALDNLFSAEWAKSMKASRLANALRVGSNAYTIHGGVFFLKQSNPKLRSAIKLQLKPVLEDTCVPYHDQRLADGWYNGIQYDQHGNEIAFSIVDQIGDQEATRPTIYSALQMIHWWNQFNPQQSRPFSEMAPSGDMWASIRRFDSATVGAAERCARMQAALKTNLSSVSVEMPQDPSQFDEPYAWQTFPFPDHGVFGLPLGWELQPLDANHPTAQYPSAKREFLSAAVRAHGVPYNVASGDSSSYNYSSSQADKQIYQRPIEVDREEIENVVLWDYLEDWLREACLVFGVDYSLRAQWSHEWGWTAPVHQDPLKEAEADIERIRYGHYSLQDIATTNNQDIREVHQQLAKDLGLTLPELQKKLVEAYFPVQALGGQGSAQEGGSSGKSKTATKKAEAAPA